MKLNCLIIDDEPAARNGLAADLAEIIGVAVPGLAPNAFEALEMINNQQPDLIFLDIHMPGLSGLDFLRLIKIKPMVILTTAHPEYALAGYELGVLDYLVKPVSPERLQMACDKAIDLHAQRNQPLPSPSAADYFFIKCNGKIEKIALIEILFIESANNYIIIHTRTKKLMAYYTLKGIESHLPADRFIRVHKSYIVSKTHIRQIDKNELVIGDVRIPVSKHFKQGFQKDIGGAGLLKR
jgi:DNA-binding LytR/AlgR family response regulator